MINDPPYAPSAVEMYLILWVKIVDGSKLIEQETNRIWHFYFFAIITYRW